MNFYFVFVSPPLFPLSAELIPIMLRMNFKFKEERTKKRRKKLKDFKVGKINLKKRERKLLNDTNKKKELPAFQDVTNR